MGGVDQAFRGGLRAQAKIPEVSETSEVCGRGLQKRDIGGLRAPSRFLGKL